MFMSYLQQFKKSKAKGEPILMRTKISLNKSLLTSFKLIGSLASFSKKTSILNKDNWYQIILERMENGIWIADDDVRVIYANPKLCELLGYSFDEIVGKTEYNFWDKESAEKVKRVVADDRIRGISSSYEAVLIAKSGEKIPCFVFGAPLPGGGTIGMMTDLREIRKKDFELRESEAKYKELFKKYEELFDTTSSGVAVYEAVDNGEDFVIMNFNKAAEKIEKINREKIIGQKVTKVFPGIKKIGLFETFKRVWETGKPEKCPVVFYADGRVSGWRENYVYKLPNGQIVTVYDDVTKRKQSEELLEKRLREFNMLYRIHSHIKMAYRIGFVLNIVAKDIAHAFKFSNDICVEIIFDGKRYRTKKYKNLIYKLEKSIVIRGVQRGILRVGYPKPIPKTGKSPFNSEERKLVETAVDILAKHIASREVLERFQKVVNKSVTGIYITQKGIIRYTNPRFCTMFKYKKSRVLNHSITDFILDAPYYKKVLKNPKVSSFCTISKGKRADGKKIDLEVVYQKIDYHGKEAALGRVQDITEIKEAERKMKNFNDELKQLVAEKTHNLEIANKRLQSLNELKDEFIAVASHELRSPLTSIRGYLSFLVEKESLDRMPENTQQYLLRAYNNAEALNNLVNNILDVSRLDTGRFELQTVKTDLIQLTKNVIDSLSFQANERNLTIDFVNSGNLEKLVLKVDPIRISQVLRNLLDNAIKYSDRGKKITVEIAKDWGFANIGISDQGVGIPEEKIKYIFNKFAQIRDADTKHIGGAGLGLFIAKRIIELHNGIIKVNSHRNQGTTFTIQLPLVSD